MPRQRHYCGLNHLHYLTASPYRRARVFDSERFLGAYNWGGFYYTSFVIDPKEDLIAVSKGPLHPTGGPDLSDKVIRLAYQSIND